MSLIVHAPETEMQLVEMLLAHVASLGATMTLREVRSHGRSRTDLVLLARNEVVGIEVKRSDWRRAIAQATLNRYCFDRSYIALWIGHVRDDVISEAKQWGLGVISVGPDGIEILRKAPRGRPERVLREGLLNRLSEALA